MRARYTTGKKTRKTKILKRASAIKNEVIVASLDLSMNDYISKSWGFLRNRRTDTYKLITKKNIK